MKIEMSFMRDIIDNLADDAPRLIYADWLQQQDGVQINHGEFIVTQCRLSSKKLGCTTFMYSCSELELGFYGTDSACDNCKEHHYLKRKEKQLLDNWKFFVPYVCLDSGWLCGNNISQDNLELLVKDHQGVIFNFHRGFVEEIICKLEDWYVFGPIIVNLTPLNKVYIKNKEPFRQSLRSWRWYCEYFNSNTHTIPKWLWKYLYYSDDEVARYESRELAEQTLSQACIDWAKSITLTLASEHE